MERKDIARCLLDEFWAMFEPLVPPAVWAGNSRKRCNNRECLPLYSVCLVGCNSVRNDAQRIPLAHDLPEVFHQRLERGILHDAWRTLAELYEPLRGINQG